MSTLLEVSGVSVTFDGFRAINNLSIQIAEPELRAVIGPNGAGKTTFMDIVTGKTKPDTGHVIWGDRNISLLGMSESQIAMAGIGRKFQKPTVFENQTVRQNLAMALKNPRGSFAVLRHRKTVRNGARIVEIAEDIGLGDELKRLAGVLSHGQKQWLEIGMLLAQDPRLLLVDEPAAGMTAQEREKTTDILKRAAETRAVVVVEHDMEFVRRLECKVTVLHEGSVLAEGSLDHVTKNPTVIDVIWGGPMLDVQNLDLHYGQSKILHDASVRTPAGVVTAIMGTNGVGKTSLLKAISGRHPYGAGTITVDGRALNHLNAAQAARQGIAYVPQGREVFAMMTVMENLQTGFACLPKSERQVPDMIFDLFPVLGEMLGRRGGDLSGGQQQQLAIARALITRPKVLLLDEPTEGIQPNIIQQIGRAIETLRAAGDMAIILVEQNLDFAYRTADRFVIMKRGEVCDRFDKSDSTKADLTGALAL